MPELVVTNHPDANVYHELVLKHPTEDTDSINKILKENGATVLQQGETQYDELQHPKIATTTFKVYGSRNASNIKTGIMNTSPFTSIVKGVSMKSFGGMRHEREYEYHKNKTTHMDSFEPFDSSMIHHDHKTSNTPSITNYIMPHQMNGYKTSGYLAVTLHDKDNSVSEQDVNNVLSNHPDGRVKHSKVKTKQGTLHTFLFTHDRNRKGFGDLFRDIGEHLPDAEVDHVAIGTPSKWYGDSISNMPPTNKKEREDEYTAHVGVDYMSGVRPAQLELSGIPKYLNRKTKMHE